MGRRTFVYKLLNPTTNISFLEKEYNIIEHCLQNDITLYSSIKTELSLIFDITKWQNRIFTFLGVLLSALFLYNNFRKERAYFFVALFITYIIVLSGISCGQGDRFHLVTFPFVILLLAKYVSRRNFFISFFAPLQK